MSNSENVGIINSSYFINANSSSENFSVSKPPAGFSSCFTLFVCLALFCIVEKSGNFINNYPYTEQMR